MGRSRFTPLNMHSTVHILPLQQLANGSSVRHQSHWLRRQYRRTVTGMIKSLQELRRHWKEADLTVPLLISQLTTLKAALNQIAEWISSSLVDIPQYRQLIIDLEESLGSCNDLITFMDHHMAKLAWTETQALTYESRVRVILEGKAIKDCLNHLNNQSNALNLLLTVYLFCTSSADS